MRPLPISREPRKGRHKRMLDGLERSCAKGCVVSPLPGLVGARATLPRPYGRGYRCVVPAGTERDTPDPGRNAALREDNRAARQVKRVAEARCAQPEKPDRKNLAPPHRYGRECLHGTDPDSLAKKRFDAVR